MVTITPECAGIKFSPVSIALRWNGSWIGCAFQFHVSGASRDRPIIIDVIVRVLGIEIARIECSLEKKAGPWTETNPLAAAKARSWQTSALYSSIFVSYSKKDLSVVRVYSVAQRALGNDVFVDTESIRAGSDWQAALAGAIDSADVFQLFWSKNASESPNVQHEWEYAIDVRAAETLGVGFVRPVYWEEPLCPPPERLSLLHFRFVPLGDFVEPAKTPEGAIPAASDTGKAITGV
jgi:hypothetical protein